jgi:cysteine desulfurase / selenocysteine lyase
MDIAAVRAFFPGTSRHTFLDSACVSLMPKQADDALRRLGQELLHCPAGDASAHHIALDATADGTRAAVAALINARPDDVALVESTTQGLEILAATLPLERGDRVLVGDTEFLGLAVPWIPRQERFGFRLEVVPSRDGRLLAADFEKLIDGHVRMILLSSVQWNNGFRADLAAFSDLARRRNLLLVVDAIQQLGAVRLDVQQTSVDFVVCGGHKWLNAPTGRGFLYVHPRHGDLTPPAWGYLNVEAPHEGWAEYFATPTIPAVRPYEFTRTTRRFEVGGTSNYPGNVVLEASLRLLLDAGPAAIEEHIRRLRRILIDKLLGVGATIVSPDGDGDWSGILTFTLGHGQARDAACLGELRRQGILISQRYTAGIGGLRVSVHLFNNEDDIERLVGVVARM